MFCLNDLYSALEDISTKPDINLDNDCFKMNEMMDEIQQIQFIERQKTECVNRFNLWCEKNQFHSFPKLKRKWITGLGSQKNICVLYLRYPVKEVLDVIRKGHKIPKYARRMYDRVLDFIYQTELSDYLLRDHDPVTDISTTEKFKKLYSDLYYRCVIVIRLSGQQCVDYLMERGILTQIGHRLYKTHKLTNFRVSKNKITSDDGDPECFDMDTDSITKKLKYS